MTTKPTPNVRFNLEGARKFKLTGNSKDAMAMDIAALLTWLHAACDEIERLRADKGETND